ncbi:MAG: serine/threonine-protein kinase [Planctomycetota bacterium]
MTGPGETRLLALLVHHGFLTRQQAEDALRSGDPVTHLVSAGVCSREEWERWRRTEAGTRPELTRYEVRDVLGQGGTARVFRALDRKSNEVVALKVLLPSLTTNRAAVQRFVTESKLLIELQHDAIVRGLRVAREGETVFCAMQLVPGECLQDRLARGEVLGEDEALRIVVQVAGALAYLHGRGLVHRDVKPGNVMWDAEAGRAVLIDLGFAARRAEGQSHGAGSPDETTVGTVHYISPEQARGAAELDVRADIYSLGATLYHLVTGSLPFEGASGEEVVAKQVLQDLSSDKFRALHLSPQIHYFIEKMMAKEKEIRFQTPQDLAQEVSAYLQSLEHREPEREPKGRRRRRRPLF